ncbi:MAG: hypothetical protein JRJ51_07355 [Deltaproteobacteria bacterium]|nr:hypothetical protein [Deltaproteobacteria bacterium]
MNPPEADKGFIPRRLRRFNAFVDTPLLCSGVVHPRPGDKKIRNTHGTQYGGGASDGFR